MSRHRSRVFMGGYKLFQHSFGNFKKNIYNIINKDKVTAKKFYLLRYHAGYIDIWTEYKIDEHCCTGTPLREKCPNTEFFLVRIFPHSD